MLQKMFGENMRLRGPIGEQISKHFVKSANNLRAFSSIVLCVQYPWKLLRSCNEVATKLDPSRIPCAPHPSDKEAAVHAASSGHKGVRSPLVAAPFLDSCMDVCGEAGEAHSMGLPL